MMRSLQAKLGSGLILSLVIVFSGLWLLISFNIHRLAEEYIVTRLRHDAEMLLSAISFDKQGLIKLDESRINPVYSQPFSGHYYRIQTDAQLISSRSLWDRDLAIKPLASGLQFRNYQAGPSQQHLLLLTNGFTKQAHGLTIVIAEDFNPIRQSIRQFQQHFALGAGAVLLLLVLVQVFILRRSLQPLLQLRHELQALQQGETKQLTTKVPPELQPMVNEINRLLGIMTQRLHRSRDALSDLAHELKKPLTIIQQLIDQQRDELSSDLVASLDRQLMTITQLIDRILKRARLAGPVQSGVHFSFQRDLPALLQTLKMMYRDRDIDVQLRLPEETDCNLDREDMLELLGNLLDNAYKWARQVITVEVSTNQELNLSIEDDGPGVESQQLQQLDKRGSRLDETTPGHGFGLAMAADMVKEYQGDISFGRSSNLGGFRVRIRLPLTRPVSGK